MSKSKISSWSEILSFILLVRLPDGLSPLLIWASFSQSIVPSEVEAFSKILSLIAQMLYCKLSGNWVEVLEDNPSSSA